MRGMMGGGSMMGQGEMGSGGMMEMMMRGRMGPEHIEGRLAYLKAELRITEAQGPQWQAFADATRSNASAMSEMRNATQKRSMSLPDRLALEDKGVTAHLAALKKTEESVAKLYAVLSDDQKKIADQIIARRCT
jgi:LTXXQ motif family protein